MLNNPTISDTDVGKTSFTSRYINYDSVAFFSALYFWYITQKEFKLLSDTIIKFISFTSTYLEEQFIKVKTRNKSQFRTPYAHNYWLPLPPSLK